MPSTFQDLIRRKQPAAATKKKKTKKKRKRSAIILPKMAPELRPEVEEVEDEEDEEEDMEEGAEVLGFKLKRSASPRLHAIQPLGNFLLLGGPSSSANARDVGLGALGILPDDVLLDVLAFLPARDIAVLSSTSRSLYVFATHDPLWRALVLERFHGDFLFCGSWRSTYRASTSRTSLLPPSETLVIRNFYSDYLFQSWLCASIEMKPEWLKIDNIERRRGISVEEFIDTFEDPNKPVLLQGCLDTWPAMKMWNRERLVRICGDVKFAVGPVDMTMERYFQYSDAAKEERPLYLFDPKFADKVLELGSEYEVPIYFREDLFSVLGKERPDYRWIIIGPAGSGSSFHVDPNSTSAWNAVIKGSKKWIMFRPEVVPPGVHPSADGAEVASPVSIMEWFMNFYAACRTWKKRPVECVCRAGEVVFVPNGWWHLVVNLEDSIAITQNYVSRSNLLNVLDFLRKPNASELVSGTKDRVNLFEKFKTAIDASFPRMINDVTAKVQEKMAEKKKPSFWESVTDAKGGGFKFSLI